MALYPVRVFNKYATNRLLRVLSHAPFGPFAVLYHVGRRSAKPYETTIMIWRLGESFVIALTYGEAVDWYRNLQAAEQARVFWRGRMYMVGRPEPIETNAALPAFPIFLRPILERAVQHFIQMPILPSAVLKESVDVG